MLSVVLVLHSIRTVVCVSRKVLQGTQGILLFIQRGHVSKECWLMLSYCSTLIMQNFLN
ncbi:unnamed protein product [Brassica napus]|uniref:(rape) hypothetical protein n=1 Tax=Brassica napus TaxID=3708 RepID=A0A816JIZ8_BRANA|nr:unnamed protein product [Brassica napus]